MKCGFVALAGKPNAGKSTLLNHLLSQKIAIVSDKPQTTRSEIRGILTNDEMQIIFTDTPGIHKSYNRLSSRMNKETSTVLQGVDVIYYVVDGTQRFDEQDESILRMLKQTNLPVFLIFNKIDTLKKEKVLNALLQWKDRFEFAEIFPISALKQDDYQDLIQTTLNYLPESELLYPVDMSTDSPINYRIAELIREKILRNTHEEVPHAVAVLIERREVEEDVCYIDALVLVEKDGQKAIIIGKQGAMLQKIVYEASKEIEEIVGMKVSLEIFVRVEKDWRQKDHRISELGYGLIDE